MTYAQLRRAISLVARSGDEGAPTSVMPVARMLELRDSGCVVLIAADRWVVTHLGFTILAHRHMPTTKPARQPRRTPAIGHGASHPHQQHQHQARSA